MNEFQKEMYAGLMSLCKNIKVFFYRDFETKDPEVVHRLFTYQLAGFMNFAEPYAMDARGTMFAVNKKTGEPLEMLALPMQKFFAIGEGDQKELEIGVKDAVRAFIKEDGTLINPYVDIVSGELVFKSSKTSVYVRSDLVKKSMSEKALQETADLFKKGFCCNFELTTPENIVKINNKEYRCHLLYIRSMKDGTTLKIRSQEFAEEYPELTKILIKEIPVSEVDINTDDSPPYSPDAS